MSIPWPCQIMFSEQNGDTVALDFVALEGCPFHNKPMEAGCPFTIQLHHDLIHQQIIDHWVAENAIVSIRELAVSDRRWLCVSEGGRFLLMELTDLAH